MAAHPVTSRREAVCAWLTANSIDPKTVPLDADLTIRTDDNGQRVIVYEAFALDEGGYRQVDERGQRCAVETRTAPLVVEPPGWWQPHQKPTREQLLETVDRALKVTEQPPPGGDGVAGEYEFGWDAAMAVVKASLQA